MSVKYKLYKCFLQVDTTFIAIQSEQPQTYIERTFEGDKTGLSEEQAIQLVLNKVKSEIDPDGAISELQELMASARKTLEATEKTLEEAKETQVKIQGALLEVNEAVFNNTADIEALKEKVGADTDA